MHLGIALPYGDIGGDGPIVREYAELAEAEGYDGLTLADHVLGELSVFAHNRAIAANVAIGQGYSEMHGRFPFLAGRCFPSNL